MAEEEPKKVESETSSSEPPTAPESAPAPEPVEASKDVPEEKSVIPPALPPPEDKAADDSKALDIVETVPDSGEGKTAEGSLSRDIVLERVSTEKRTSLIKAWEESEKAKAENKAHKKLLNVGAWENSKKATIEAEMKKIEEKLEKQKAENAEKLKNNIAIIHKEAEEKRAMVEAQRGEDFLKAEEKAAKYRATGTGPKKLFGLF